MRKTFRLDTSLRWNVKQSNFIPIAVLFPLIVYVCMSLSALGMSLLSYATLGSFLVSFIFLNILVWSNEKMSLYGFFSFIFYSLLFLFSLINSEQSSIKEGLYVSFEVWAFLMLCFYYRERIHIVIQASSAILSFCVYVNFIHLMLHQELWIQDLINDHGGFLLGNNYNGMGFRFIVAIVFSVLCIRYSKKWIVNTVLVILLSITPLVITGSMTSLVCIIFFIIVCCIPSVRLQRTIVITAFLFGILFQVFVVFSGKGLEDNELAVYFVEELLGKDITFTMRTYLWDMSMQKILESPIVGYGFLDNEWYQNNIYTSAGTGPCNMMLSILLNGGIILFSLFLIIVIISVMRIQAYHDYFSQVIQMGVATILIMHLMEMQSYVFVFILLALSFYYPEICKENDNYNDLNIETHS